MKKEHELDKKLCELMDAVKDEESILINDFLEMAKKENIYELD